MNTKTCPSCNRTFGPHVGEKPARFARRQSCSHACGARLRSGPTKRRYPDPPPRACYGCGETLVRREGEPLSRFATRKCCSMACRDVGTRARMTKRTPEQATCELASCGATFKPAVITQRFCSRDCARASNAQHNRRATGGWLIAWDQSARGPRCTKTIPYIDKVYDTEAAANEALRDLLKPYPAGHEWRRKLCVTFSAVPGEVKAEAAA